MPHYKDGTPAEIGDFVKGVPYNNGGKEIVGTMVQITEGTESCNCIVAFVDPAATSLPIYELQQANIALPPVLTRRKGGRIRETDPGEQEHLLLRAKFDYGAVKDFTKV
jgi:hypothetical protein